MSVTDLWSLRAVLTWWPNVTWKTLHQGQGTMVIIITIISIIIIQTAWSWDRDWFLFK